MRKGTRITKAEKARRRREERQQLERLREFNTRVALGGLWLTNIFLGEVAHAQLDTARRLGCCIVLRPDPIRECTWNVLAAKE